MDQLDLMTRADIEVTIEGCEDDDVMEKHVQIDYNVDLIATSANVQHINPMLI